MGARTSGRRADQLRPLCITRHYTKHAEGSVLVAAGDTHVLCTASVRTQEIQRLIGRSLRAIADLGALGERTIKIDCDVLQADGGTRCASITGACIALADAVAWCRTRELVASNVLTDFVAAVSVGMVGGTPMLDLDYGEDSGCDTDMNVVMTGAGGFVEVQGTAEGAPFSRQEMDTLLALAERGIGELIAQQRAAVAA